MISKVSVVIPTWNRAHTIEKAIRSALNQTVSPLEVLVCDDGSTDNSEETVQAIGDDRVRWITGSRGGRPAIPRNRGIRESKGEWLAFLDSDDEWLPQKLEQQLALAAGTGCRAICSNAYRLLPDRGIVGPYLSVSEEKKLFNFKDLIRNNVVICSSVLLHKSLINDVIGFPEGRELIVGEDYALWLRVATQTEFAYTGEYLLIYRDDAANSIRSESKNFWIQTKAVLNDFMSWTRISGQFRIDKKYMHMARLRSLQASIRNILSC